MASRHFRKLEEERMVAAAEAANSAAEAEGPAPAPRSAAFSFADLGGESSSDEDSSDSEEERERRGAAAETRTSAPKQPQKKQQKQQQAAAQSKQAKKKAQQAKKKGAAAANDAWSPDDEAMIANIAAAQAASEAEVDVLEPDPKFLDPQSELKRIFGGGTIKAAMREQQQERRGGQQGQRGRGGGGRGGGGRPSGAAARARKTILVQARDHWPPYTPGGLEMEVTGTVGDEVMFSFVHGADYQQAQREYEVAASSHDPNAIVGVLQFYPYHIGSLMQLAEVHSIRGGELERAGDMYERALFGMERSFNADFTPWASGKQGLAAGRACRLPYSVVENRPLYVALFRYAGLLGRRGVHRTAVEVCRLLLSLEPRSDPMGTLLCFDYFCLRSGGGVAASALLLPFVEKYQFRQVLQLPNFSYSVALAKRLGAVEAGTASTAAKAQGTALRMSEMQRLVSVTEPTSLSPEELAVRALALYPSILPPLLAKAGAASDPAAIGALTHAFFDKAEAAETPYSSLLARLVEVYIERSAALHKQQESAVWLATQAMRVTAAIDASSRPERSAFDDAAHAVRLRALTGEDVPDAWSSVLLADYSDDVTALPADEMIGGQGQGGGGEGREEGEDAPFQMERGMHPLLAFFATMLPSAGAPAMHAD